MWYIVKILRELGRRLEDDDERQINRRKVSLCVRLVIN